MGPDRRIDVLAAEPQFIDHLAPVYLALPPDSRGDFVIARSGTTRMSPDQLLDRAASRGVRATTTGDASRPVLVASWGDQNRAMRAGRSVIARMEHGIGQSFRDSNHVSYAGGGGAERVGLFLTPNEHSANRWREAYPQTPVVVVGCPKLDDLPSRTPGDGPVIATSFHWGRVAGRNHPLAETFGSFMEYGMFLGGLAKRYTVIGHGHPRLLRQMVPTYRRAGIQVVEDFADVCRLADVYVCDTNSTIFEFASTGRPVVVVNGKHFRRDVHHGLRFWDAAGVGVNCNRPADLPEAIAEAIRDSPAQRQAREDALDIVYAYRTGAAERAVEALVRWAATVHAMAA